MTMSLLAYRARTAIAAAALLLALVLSTGCPGNGAVDDAVPTEQQTESPDSSELQEHPCSNPNWDEPPPQVTSLDDEEE